MRTDCLYYRNGKSSKPRITLDFIGQIFQGLSQELKSADTLDFITKTRIPNERELYGLLVKALLKVGGDEEDIGHVATEIQVSRISDESESSVDSTGRVDILVNYRKTVFLIEVKVARMSMRSAAFKTDRVSKATKSWESAVGQLKTINSDKVRDLLDKDIKKLALLINLHYDGRIRKHEDGLEHFISENFRQISNQIDEKSKKPPEYEWLSVFDESITPHRRMSKSVENKQRVTLYGYSFLAAAVD